MTRTGDRLLNYTTSIEVEKTVAEIEHLLHKSGATSILKELDASSVKSISFQIEIKGSFISFKLPMDAQPVQEILNKQVKEGLIPRKFYNDLDQARRVGWRILKQWVEAQLAIIQTKMVEVQQVFLPYAVGKDGRTLYEMMKEGDYKNLLPEHQENTKQRCLKCGVIVEVEGEKLCASCERILA